MKGNRLLLAAAAALVGSSAPSFAGNPNIDEHMFHGRREIQLIDNSYLFNDLRRQPSLPQTIVIEAPQQSQPAPPPLMIHPGMSNQPVVTILHNGLPDAGFQSAITPSSMARPRNLPSGNSTNMLAGKMLSQAPAGGAAKATPNAAPPRAALLPSAPKTMVYSSQPSNSGMSNFTTKTSVSGLIQTPAFQRGSILANHH